MTSNARFRERNRDVQDLVERQMFVSIEHVPNAGSVIKTRGTGSEEEDTPVISGTTGFNLEDDTNAEVLMLSGGSDTNMKFALVTLPRDKQRPWKKGRGGVQSPSDPDFALEFRNGKAVLTKGSLSIGEDGLVEVKDGKVFIRGNVVIGGTLTVNGGIKSSSLTPGTETIPPVVNE